MALHALGPGESIGGARHRVFVYGTLMDDDLVAQLTGRRFDKQAAVLAGYRKVVPPDGYAYIVPYPTGVVRGFVLQGVDEAALHTLDRYEGEGQLYRRTRIVVSVDGDPQPAMAYVGMPEAQAES